MLEIVRGSNEPRAAGKPERGAAERLHSRAGETARRSNEIEASPGDPPRGSVAATSGPTRRPRPLRWRLLLDPPLGAARNMALDHALAAHLEPGEGVLRLYGWSRPTVSFGRNEPARALYGGPRPARRSEPGAAAGEAADLDFVRRPTGGRAVVHWRELTYAVIGPLHAWGGLRAAYVAINEGLGAALHALGVAVEIAGSPSGGDGDSAAVLPLSAGPCFGAPAPGEVTATGRKLVGSAQARLEGALLQHGSILLEDDQGLLEALKGEPPGGGAGPVPGGRPASLRELVGHVSIDELRDVVATSLRESFGGRWASGGAPGGYRPRELDAAARLEEERYALDSWTWRR